MVTNAQLEVKPTLLSMDHDDDRLSYFSAIKSGSPHIVDTYREQLEELCALRNPHLRDDAARMEIAQKEFISAHAANRDLQEVGVWVLYPWKNTMVHCLSQDLFEELRTARNRNLITEKEQRLFRDCKVGIAGLSVGSHVALTLALQGGCRRMHLADADTLSGSNLNRVRAGIDALGQNKAALVARYIYEMNPFVDLTLFTDGVREENIKEFFGTETPIDILVDEMDSLPMKLRVRQVARERHIPVLMAADNGDGIIIDVERFDYEPQPPLFHGRLKEDDKEFWYTKPVSTEDIAARITKFVGEELVEPRMLSSVHEVGRTLYSWPQLGGTANLAGIAVSYLVREIACKRAARTGRFVFSLGQIFE